jgi:hypothetical protein
LERHQQWFDPRWWKCLGTGDRYWRVCARWDRWWWSIPQRAIDDRAAANSASSAEPRAQRDASRLAAASALEITLNAAGYRVRGKHTVNLLWSGTKAANIDIYRDGLTIAAVPNAGSYTDNIGVRSGNVC